MCISDEKIRTTLRLAKKGQLLSAALFTLKILHQGVYTPCLHQERRLSEYIHSVYRLTSGNNGVERFYSLLICSLCNPLQQRCVHFHTNLFQSIKSEWYLTTAAACLHMIYLNTIIIYLVWPWHSFGWWSSSFVFQSLLVICILPIPREFHLV